MGWGFVVFVIAFGMPYVVLMMQSIRLDRCIDLLRERVRMIEDDLYEDDEDTEPEVCAPPQKIAVERPRTPRGTDA